MCKWDERGHVNLGDGPAANAAEFLTAVAELIDADS